MTSTELPYNISQLAENNRHKTSTYKDGDKFMEAFLTKKQYARFAESKPTFTPYEKLRSVNERIGVVLVRPEMYHIKDGVIQFLGKHGFKTVESRDLIVSPHQYWQICCNSICLQAAKLTMPTRTMIYTGGTACALRLHMETNNYQGEHAADVLVTNFKGKAGVYEPDTLRGELVYEESTRLGFQNPHPNPELSMAIDPFDVYSAIANGNEQKMMSLNSVCIHIPDSREIRLDLRSLFPN